MRKITLNANGDLSLIDANDLNSQIDFSGLSLNHVSNASKEYSNYGQLSDYSNEIFINYFIRRFEWRALIRKEDTLIKAKQKSVIFLLWNEFVEETTSSIKVQSKAFSILAWFKILICYLAFLGIVLFRKLKNFNFKNMPLNKIVIIRSKASYSKLRPIAERLSLSMFSEDIIYSNSKLDSIFSILTFRQCFLAVFRALVPSIIELKCLIRELEAIFDRKVAAKLIYSYSARVVHKCIFEQLLTVLLKANSISELVTGNKEDRFAMVEKRTCANAGIPLTCIPHGLEYAYKFPTGIAGDIFYCTSSKAQVLLSNLYTDICFIYDESLQSLIYSNPKSFFIENQQSKKIVFFTESRDIEVNRKIIDELISMKIDFKVKLHPKDVKKNYLDKKITILENYEEAIFNSICISRKSTVLIEAPYNNSVSIAFLINSKDRYYVNEILPSLTDPNIYKCLNKDALIQLILTL